MPSVLYDVRQLMTVLALSGAVLISGCGSKEGSGNSTEVQMKDLETVDGTINDAMTDLDGVRSEGTAMANTGDNSASSASPAKTANKEAAGNSSGESGDTEVVADQ